ncbi:MULTISPECIES: serpin family protein [unclassified Streptomyces]|uniref:serpin family protein n=1 Tax=unclassified Streptomyces TaxID=2593676 RepID=UPI0011C9B711|nr:MULTISPECIES: serpin family protein [unclassified Streptomyces]TXS08723.1 serine protease [Streptomyces sp. wa22]WSQ87568.1 serpin family protein [Streptomyces sp. NBC_01212]WSR06421.1 serpin family protein [Streptomyces sp. NBC_01208]WSR50971.1 serpin family protein [Streptomyces sp. NBC_01201]
MERETGPEAAVQRLGEQWIRELAQPGGGSFVCSPAGLWLALTAVASGARGGTAAELRALLGVAGSEAAAVVTDAARDWGRTEALRVATRVWNSAPVHPEYERSLPDVAFGPVDAAEADAWVRERTDGLIDKLPLEIDGDMALVLVNVLALKALWERAFDTGRTRDAAFTDAAGTSRPVATMHASVPLADVWPVPGGYVVELRCRAEPGGTAPARVRFVLGEPGEGAADVLPRAWAATESRTLRTTDVVTVALPRFTLRTTIPVTDQLPALGVRLATDASAADLSGLSPWRLHVSEVVQEAVVKIAEKGVEAAAVTVVALRAAAVQPRVVRHIAFDRPFGVVVLDGSSDVPLFAGWQADVPCFED